MRDWEVRWGPLSHPSRRRGGLRDQERGGSSRGKDKYLLVLQVNLWRKLTGLDPVPPLRAALLRPVLRLHHSRAGSADRHVEAAGAEWGGVRTSLFTIWDTVRTLAGKMPPLPVPAWPQHNCFVAGILD